MSTNELKQLFKDEHKKEIRITLIKNAIFLLIALLVIYLIYTFAFKEASEYLKGVRDTFDTEKNPSATTYRYIVLAMIITGIGYFIYDIVTVIRRSAKIDEFITKVESGKIATHIYENVVYKVTLPLGKIKLMLFPMTFVAVKFNKEMKVYKLPVPLQAMNDLKTLLSGVKQSDLNKAWYELYDGTTNETTTSSELKSTTEFQRFVDTDLNSEITEIEQKRAKGQKSYITYLIPTALIVIIWGGIMYGFTSGKLKMDMKTMLIGFAVIFIPYYAYIYFVKVLPNRNKPVGEEFDIQFKTKVFTKIIQYINPNFKYVIHGHVSLGEFLEMGFFQSKGFSLGGNDQIIGKHSGVPFQLCDLNVSYKRNFSNEGERPDEVFFGQVFVAKFNKEFKNDVYIIPKKVDGAIYSKSDTSLYFDSLGQKVMLEDPEFSKLFTVYATDQIEARYILSTSLMNRIKEIAQANPKGKYMISFRNNRISIANNSRINNFELSMFKSITKNNQVVKFYEELTNQLKIIDDLKLNVNIWK